MGGDQGFNTAFYCWETTEGKYQPSFQPYSKTCHNFFCWEPVVRHE